MQKSTAAVCLAMVMLTMTLVMGAAPPMEAEPTEFTDYELDISSVTSNYTKREIGGIEYNVMVSASPGEYTNKTNFSSDYMILKVSEVMEDPQIQHREMVVDLEYRGYKFKDKGIPVKMSKTPGSIRMMPPTQGQHTDEVLKSIGYTDEQLAALRESGAIL